MDSIIDSLAYMFSSLFDLAFYLFVELDGIYIWLSAVLIALTGRLLLFPIVGGVIRGGQSDAVKSIRGKKKENKDG